MKNLLLIKNWPYCFLKLLSTILILLLNNVLGVSQDINFCEMPAITTPTEVLECESDDDPVDPSIPFYVTIYIHVITDDNGEGGFTYEEAHQAFDMLYGVYASLNIFFVWCGDVNTIKSDEYMGYQALPDMANVFSTPHVHSDGIDVFLFPADHFVNGGRAKDYGDPSGMLISGRNSGTPGIPLAHSAIIIHEMGHVLGLYHTFETSLNDPNEPNPNCCNTGDLMCNTPFDPGITANSVNALTCLLNEGGGDNGPDTHNYMSYTAIRCMDQFQPDQIQEMRNNVASDFFLPVRLTAPPLNPCNCSSSVIIINEDTEYNENKSIGNYIYIKNGATLTINNATLFFNEYSGIRVFGGGKLVLNGATLTKCILGDSWKGVEVDGRIDFFGTAYEGGELNAMEKSLIEYAEIGVKSFKGNQDPFIGPFVPVGTGGGKITIDNSTIENCKTAMLLGVSDNEEDYTVSQSYIMNCLIGIRLLGAGITVSFTEFEDCDEAIINESFSPNTQQISLLNNTFSDYDCAIYSGAVSSLDNLVIANNTIEGEEGDVGIFIDGQTNFDIINNTIFGNKTGIAIHATGNNQLNSIRGNQFSGNDKACNVQFLTSSAFTVNCFYDSEIADIAVLNGSGLNATRLNPEQGNQNQAAGNCFSETRFQFGSNYMIPFSYYTKDGFNNIESCKYPGQGGCPNGSGGGQDCITIIEVFEETGNCDDEFTPLDDDCVFVENLTSEEIVKLLFDDIEAINFNDNLSSQIKEEQINNRKDCLAKFVKKTTKEMLIEGKKEEAIIFLSSIPDFKAQILAYGLIIESYDVEWAKAQLNSITTTTDDELDFIAAQKVYLGYLENIEEFELNQSDQEMIERVAHTVSPLAAYTRAIHYLLTGKRIVLEIGDLERKRADKKLSNNHQNKPIGQAVSVYPNPINNDLLNINLQQYYKESDQFIMKIYTVYGRLVQQSSLYIGQNQVDFSKQLKGVYLMKIEKNGEFFSSKKIIK